ncbi:MAG: sulfatase [Deltaproteobacteria bacterium]|nr:sulfatase [Deltaproteobacteria bacterium]
MFWWQWSARVALAAVALALLELALVIALVPLAGSSPLGLLSLTHLLVACYAVVLLPLAGAGVLLERRAGGWLKRALRWERADAATIASVCLSVAIAVPTIRLLVGLGAQYVEFPARVDLVVYATMGAMLLGLALVTGLVLRPALAWLLSRYPRLDDPARLVGLLLTLGVLLGLTTIHLGLGALLLERLAAAAGAGCAAGALAAAFATLSVERQRDGKVAAAALLVLVVLAPVSSCRNGHANYVLFNHSHAGGALAAVLRDLVDVDRDGAASVWLGGTDCAELDDTRSPGRRDVAGDGIDQDCRGGDAPAQQSSPPATAKLWSDCEPPEQPLSLLLIVLDAVRAELVDPRLTPTLWKLRGESLHFTRAYSAAATTLQSLPPLFAGRSLSSLSGEHMTLLEQHVRLGATLAVRLSKAGYYGTAIENLELPDALRAGFANRSAWWLDSAPRNGKERFEAAAITNEALRVMAAQGQQPLFLWIHYTDAHAPYLELDTSLRGASRYEVEVAYVDFHLGRLLAGMKRNGMAQRSVVVVTADHGEELGQRSVEGHGRYLYETSIHVPLLVRVPGCQPRELTAPVSLAQVAPTLAALAGVEMPGPSLLGDGAKQSFVVSETLDQRIVHRAVVGQRYKLIHDVRNGGRVMFDLQSDPREEQDVYPAEAQAAARLETHYQRWLDQL